MWGKAEVGRLDRVSTPGHQLQALQSEAREAIQLGRTMTVRREISFPLTEGHLRAITTAFAFDGRMSVSDQTIQKQDALGRRFSVILSRQPDEGKDLSILLTPSEARVALGAVENALKVCCHSKYVLDPQALKNRLRRTKKRLRVGLEEV